MCLCVYCIMHNMGSVWVCRRRDHEVWASCVTGALVGLVVGLWWSICTLWFQVFQKKDLHASFTFLVEKRQTSIGLCGLSTRCMPEGALTVPPCPFPETWIWWSIAIHNVLLWSQKKKNSVSISYDTPWNNSEVLILKAHFWFFKVLSNNTLGWGRFLA